MTASPLKTRTGLIAGAAALALFAGACTPDTPTGDQPVTLQFWGWVPGLEEAVAEWNEANPHIQVDFFRMTGDDGDSVPAAIDSGTAPDIVQMSVHSIPGHLINNRLHDLTDYVADLEDEFTPSSWGSVVYADSVFAIPQDSGPTALMYREDIFEEHDIEVPTTWEEYIQAGRDLQAADPELYIGQFSPNEMGFWLQQVWQNGGSYFGIEGDAWTVNVADEASMEVAEVWQTLLDEELVRVVEMWTPEFWSAVNNGSIASIHYAAWFPVLLEDSSEQTAGNWRVAPSPTFGDEPSAGDTGGSVNVIPTSSDNIEPAVEFLTWLNTSADGVSYLIDGGVFPSALSALEDPNLLAQEEYFGGQVINEVFSDAAELVPADWVDGPSYDLMSDDLSDAFAQVANGGLTFEEALLRVQDRNVNELRNLGLDVVE